MSDRYPWESCSFFFFKGHGAEVDLGERKVGGGNGKSGGMGTAVRMKCIREKKCFFLIYKKKTTEQLF